MVLGPRESETGFFHPSSEAIHIALDLEDRHSRAGQHQGRIQARRSETISCKSLFPVAPNTEQAQAGIFGCLHPVSCFLPSVPRLHPASACLSTSAKLLPPPGLKCSIEQRRDKMIVHRLVAKHSVPITWSKYNKNYICF